MLLNERSAEQGGWNPYLMHAMERLLGWVGQYINVSTLDLRGALLRWLEQISRFLLSWGAQVVSNIISFLVEAVVAFFTLFFLFREGGAMKQRAIAILPLKSGQVERLFTGISDSIIANVYGCLAVGVAQGTLVSIAFLVLGLPSPVLWGVVTALFSLIPIIGSAAVWAPAVMILVAGGHWWKGLILLGWGAGIVGQVDSLVRPYVIGQRAKMHTLLVFFALLGGVKAFGRYRAFRRPRRSVRHARFAGDVAGSEPGSPNEWVARAAKPECFRGILRTVCVRELSSATGATIVGRISLALQPQYAE